MSSPGTREFAENPRIRALIDAIKTEDWTRIDLAWDRARRQLRDQDVSHLRRDAEADPRTFLRKALKDAERLGILPTFIRELVGENLLTEDFLRFDDDVVRARQWEPEQFQNDTDLPSNPMTDWRDQMHACDHVCRIDIDGQPMGSGIQVSARLVATAAHVIKPLLARRPDGTLDVDNGSLRSADNSLRRLVVRFGHAWDYVSEDSSEIQLTPGEVVYLHSEWLIWGSQPASSDWSLTDRPLADVEDISGIGNDGPWDVALIQLAGPRRRLKPPPRLLDSYPPAGKFAITVLHHPNDGMTPGGPPISKSPGVMSKNLGWPPRRSLHNANTRPGSSGAPVFNRDWRVVALHQGAVRDSHYDGAAGAGSNRAVPVWGWRQRVSDLEDWMGEDFTYLTTLTTATDLEPRAYPVFGRRETQERVQRAMRPDASPQQRLLLIRGEGGTGLRFTKRLIRELVARTDGVLAALDMANALNDSAAGIVERISGALSAEEERHLPPDQAALTTGQRMIRARLVPVLGRRLERTARDRAKWVVLESIGDVSAGIPAVVTDVINALISYLPELPTLRLVLVGWPYTPAGYEGSVEELRPVTAEDLVRYFCPAGDRADTAMAEAIRHHFALTVEEEGIGYPTAHLIANQITSMFRPQLGDGT